LSVVVRGLDSRPLVESSILGSLGSTVGRSSEAAHSFVRVLQCRAGAAQASLDYAMSNRYGEDQDQDHTNIQSRLLCATSNPNITNNPNSESFCFTVNLQTQYTGL